jgi:hypothetical protein
MKAAAWLALWLLLPATAQAGTTCVDKPYDPAAVYRATLMAAQVYKRLEELQAEAAIIGRIGSDLSEYGLKYSHAGIVLRDHPKGRWLIRHKLNQCGSERGNLYDEGLVNFFNDDPFRMEALLLVPSPELQRRIRQDTASPLAIVLHQPRYSLLANPFALAYQNSNGWVLEILASTLSPQPILSRAQAQQFLQQTYQADTIALSLGARLGAGMFKGNVAFDDHPSEAEASGKYQTVTVRSLARYLLDHDPGLQSYEIPLQCSGPGCR